MWEFFIKNRSFSYLLIGALLCFGIFSIAAIPKESAPEIQVPVGVVTTLLPGAPAVDIESLITNELERGLAGSLEKVKKITSTSRESVSSIVVEFEADADIDQSIRSLKDKVDTLVNRLPGDAERPVVNEINFVDQPIITLAVSGDRSEEEFSILADNLIDELEAITGVSKVEKSGTRDREVSVVVDPTALLRFNLTIPDVLNGIRVSNSVFPVGQIVSDNVSYNIVFAGDIETVEEVGDIPIAVRGGQPVLVKDVADVRVGLAAASTFSRLSVSDKPSESSVVFSIYKQRGGDITELADTIQNKLKDLQVDGQLLSGLTVFTVQDAGELIKKDLTQLTNSGLLTIFLVVVILIVAIGWREGLIAGLAIPLSFTIGFIGLYLSGNTINFISLFALILGIGVLVDSGIVIVEGIHKRMKDDVNINKVDAALLTVREFSSPLISGTLTTVSMFVGLLVVSGVTGQFIASIPFTLIFVLFASLLVALGFLPLISSVLMHRRATNKMEVYQEKYSHKLESWYKTNLTKILASARRKKVFLTAIIVGFFCSIALIPLGLVQVVFFAQSDSEALFVEVELPEGSVKESTDIGVEWKKFSSTMMM
ncbi:MAG: efflux RND transporter permease subunit [Candidatus Paceibacterota bacterium]